VTAAAPAGTGTSALVSAAMEPADVPEVVTLLRATPGVGFCEWEDRELLARHLVAAPGLCRVARDGDEVVGALIAGSFGVRGTISHIAIAPPYRRRGLAQRLVDDVLEAFRERGVRRLFLFVIDGYEPADRLWSNSGFRPTIGERTLECDL
jgi:ribosomal protein S18 acetylase RimI-like enzyme